MKIRVKLLKLSTRELASSRFPKLEVMLEIELERDYFENSAYRGVNFLSLHLLMQ